MKWIAAAIGLAGTMCAIMGGFQAHKPVEIVITGDIDGFLTPCGCTVPMTGGIMRQATLVRQLRKSAEVLLLCNGAFVLGRGKQDDLKARSLAETLGALNVSAINLSPEDARRGIGAVQEIQNLTDNSLVCGSIRPISALPIRTTAVAGPILVGGVSAHPANIALSMGTYPIPEADAVRLLLREAADRSLMPALLLDGSQADARDLAERFPDLRLIVYRSTSDSPLEAEKIGQTLLVTPGQFGKSVIRLSVDGAAFSGYQVVRLNPDLKDDPLTKRFMADYLRSLDASGLLEEMVRRPSRAFAGSKTCGTCHKEAFNLWAGSKHSRAFGSLEVQGHAHDPDCVRCHVVGLDLSKGFRSRQLTPGLAAVGCESCHGPGKDHAARPHAVRLSKAGTEMCSKCHTPEQSPGFNALTMWAVIRHR